MKFMIRKQFGLYLFNAIALLVIVAFAFLSGCDKTLDGVQVENKAPIVEFVNIPPGPVYDTVSTDPLVVDTILTKFSRNPLIYWYGSDSDGQIDYYRYMVKTEAELNGLTPDEYIVTISDDSTDWIYLDIIQTIADPQTTDIIKLKALSDDPLATYLVQYVFLQAVDEMGKASEIVYRAYSRNDSPPNTFISKLGAASFINSKTPGVITGVSLEWRAIDPDYPGDENVPPFDFQWRLYGPFNNYVDDENGDPILEFYDKYLSTIYITPTQRVIYNGEGIELCDTSIAQNTITCSTYVVGRDDFPEGVLPGVFTQILDVERIEADNDSVFNKLVYASDGWTNDSSLVVFDVYKDFVAPVDGDTTIEMSFVFWVKSRDDALVEDLVPDFQSFKVIDPRFERHVMVADFNPTANNAQKNAPLFDSDNPEGQYLVSRNFWKSVVDHWGESKFPGGWDDSKFDITLKANGTARDYLFTSSSVPIVSMLKHKVVILYYDEIDGMSGSLNNVYDAIDAGVNVWLCMRNSVGGSYGGMDFFDMLDVSGDYQAYFAVNLTNFTNWGKFAFEDSIYIQDFVGAISGEELGGWPNLPLDTALLHANYMWVKSSLGIKWVPEHPAMPEVNWMGFRQKYPFPGTGGDVYANPIYLYNSRLNQDRAENGPSYLMRYQGSPVGHIVDGPYFKTVHFSFTPLAIQPDSFKIASDRVLNYLYEEDLIEPVSKNRYR